MIRSLLAAGLLALAAPLPAQDAAERVAWNKPAAPFRVIGQVYYVGTAGISAFLVADPAGLVLIDGGLPESAPLIAANVRRLGFAMKDVRYLLINHAHGDHAGGLAALQRASGAPLVASRGDAPDLIAGRTRDRPELDGFPPVRPARIVDDGGVVQVGRTRLVAHVTPGHTDGCTSWSLRTREGDRPIDVLFACSLTVAGRPLVRRGRDTAAVAQFRRTFRALKTLHPDVFLSFHAGAFDLDAKRARLARGDRFAFVDRAELATRAAAAERAFAAELARQRAAPQS